MKLYYRGVLRNMFLMTIGSVKKPKSGIHILSSHFVSKSLPDYEKYCEFLDYYRKNCSLVRFEESVEMINLKKKPNDCLVSFSYDDGFEECYSIIAPALEEFKVNGCFFICGNYTKNATLSYREHFGRDVLKVENKDPMSWNQIKDLNFRGHIIGSHTLDHINMNTKDLDKVEYQLVRNKQLIEECISKPCDHFAIPFGQLKYINDQTLKITEKYHKHIFSLTNHRLYYSCNGRVVNRRHIEGDWPKQYLNYFLSVDKNY